MRLFFTRVALALMVAGTAYAPSQAGTVTFGSGGNQFNMDFVTIGNAGNAADTVLPLLKVEFLLIRLT